MILNIPLLPVPNQRLKIVLNGQQCTLDVYTRDVNQNNGITELLVDTADQITYLGIDPDNPDNVLLVNVPNTTEDISNNIYVNLYVGQELIGAGMRVSYGTVINQYDNPSFKGYLFMNTADKLDPIYTDFSGTTTLNYTDGVLSNG